MPVFAWLMIFIPIAPLIIMLIIYIVGKIGESMGLNWYHLHEMSISPTGGYCDKETRDISFENFLALKKADPDHWKEENYRIYYNTDNKVKYSNISLYTQIIFCKWDFIQYVKYLKKEQKIAVARQFKESQIISLENAKEITDKVKAIADANAIKTREQLDEYINQLLEQYKDLL